MCKLFQFPERFPDGSQYCKWHLQLLEIMAHSCSKRELTAALFIQDNSLVICIITSEWIHTTKPNKKIDRLFALWVKWKYHFFSPTFYHHYFPFFSLLLRKQNSTDKPKWIWIRIMVLYYCRHSLEKTHFCHQWVVEGYIAEDLSFFSTEVISMFFTES